MINELKKLADSMKKSDIEAKRWNKHFNEIKGGKNIHFRLFISADGQITRISPLEDVSCLRTYGSGRNGNTFPAFNFTPFYQFDKSMSKSAKSELLKIKLDKLDMQDMQPNVAGISKTDRKDADRVTAECLGKVADVFFSIIMAGKSTPSMFATFHDSQKKLRAPENTNDTIPLVFQRKLLTYFSQELKNGMSPDDPRISIQFDLHGKVVLFFDIETPEPDYIANGASMDWINEKLEQANRCEGADSSPVTDAFGNNCDSSELDEKMPSVKLPKIPNTHLRSMTKDILCQTRYGMIDALSFPVGKEIRAQAKAALEWICADEREDQTWTAVGTAEVLFAYPNELPKLNIPIYLARMLGNGNSKKQRFINCAQDTIQQLKLHASTLGHVDIELFAIKSADKARRKVVFYRNYDAEHLRQSVELWNTGAANIPDFQIFSWARKDKSAEAQKSTPVPMQFNAPYPLAAMRAVYSGKDNTTPKCRRMLVHDNIPVFDGLELFLDDSVQTGLVQRCLSMILQNGMSLFLAVKNSVQKQKKISSDISDYLETALPLIGILQYKLKIRKEFYMNESPYLLGKMLNLADGLHKLYCEENRNNDIPRELLGGIFYVQIANHPRQAFGALGIRMIPYLKWAKTTKEKLAHWYLKEFSAVSDALQQNGIPEKLTDADKAQMLLGYLGSLKAKDETLNKSNTQEEQK